MRPRKTPAENRYAWPRSANARTRFNEAAENTRGKPDPDDLFTYVWVKSASMRPRKTPAEN